MIGSIAQLMVVSALASAAMAAKCSCKCEGSADSVLDVTSCGMCTQAVCGQAASCSGPTAVCKRLWHG